MQPGTLELIPETILTGLETSSSKQVEERFGSTPLLLVELDDSDDALEAGLWRTLEREGKPPRPSLSLFSQTSPGLTTVSIPKRDETEVDPLELLARLRRHRYFAMPLFKRTAAGDPEGRRVTVGRASECDVLLRHNTVSKQHAFFELDDGGTLYLRDQQSKNGTHVNGKRLTPGEPRWLQPLDHIHFGSVSAFTCQPLVLRGVIRNARTSS